MAPKGTRSPVLGDVAALSKFSAGVSVECSSPRAPHPESFRSAALLRDGAQVEADPEGFRVRLMLPSLADRPRAQTGLCVTAIHGRRRAGGHGTVRSFRFSKVHGLSKIMAVVFVRRCTKWRDALGSIRARVNALMDAALQKEIFALAKTVLERLSSAPVVVLAFILLFKTQLEVVLSFISGRLARVAESLLSRGFKPGILSLLFG